MSMTPIQHVPAASLVDHDVLVATDNPWQQRPRLLQSRWSISSRNSVDAVCCCFIGVLDWRGKSLRRLYPSPGYPETCTVPVPGVGSPLTAHRMAR